MSLKYSCQAFPQGKDLSLPWLKCSCKPDNLERHSHPSRRFPIAPKYRKVKHWCQGWLIGDRNLQRLFSKIISLILMVHGPKTSGPIRIEFSCLYKRLTGDFTKICVCFSYYSPEIKDTSQPQSKCLTYDEWMSEWISPKHCQQYTANNTMLSNCGAREESWESLARRSNQSLLKEIYPEYSLEGLLLKLKLQYFGHLMWRTDSLEKTLLLWKMEGKRRRGWQRMR